MPTADDPCRGKGRPCLTLMENRSCKSPSS
jgi:hypothetical protein